MKLPPPPPFPPMDPYPTLHACTLLLHLLHPSSSEEPPPGCPPPHPDPQPPNVQALAAVIIQTPLPAFPPAGGVFYESSGASELNSLPCQSFHLFLEFQLFYQGSERRALINGRRVFAARGVGLRVVSYWCQYRPMARVPGATFWGGPGVGASGKASSYSGLTADGEMARHQTRAPPGTDPHLRILLTR